MKRIKSLLLMLMVSVFVLACGKKTNLESDVKKIKVTTTINYFVNLVEEIGKDKVEVTGLMGEGVDPHDYVATEGDVAKLNDADLVVYGGLHLEGKMTDVFASLKDKPVLDLGATIDPSKLVKEEEGVYDPHVWFNSEFWLTEAKAVADKLSEIDPENKDFYQANLTAYEKEVKETESYIKNRISEIPEESRVLITAHDAFGYYALQYGLEVKAIQGVSTDSEISVAAIDELADFIAKHKVKAIFVESSVNDKGMKALQEAVKSKGFEVKIGGELYSDSLGGKDNTWVKALKANTDTIVDALK